MALYEYRVYEAVPGKLPIGYSDATVLHEIWRRAGSACPRAATE